MAPRASIKDLVEVEKELKPGSKRVALREALTTRAKELRPTTVSVVVSVGAI